jgi:hypothetical protein
MLFMWSTDVVIAGSVSSRIDNMGNGLLQRIHPDHRVLQENNTLKELLQGAQISDSSDGFRGASRDAPTVSR